MKLLCCLIFTSSLCSIYAQDDFTSNYTDNGIDPRNIRVWLYTSANTSKPQFDLAVNEIDILTNETYDPSNSLLVVIHGFKGTSNETTYLRIKDGYILKGRWNVILLDWAPLSNVDRYALAVNNANTVALLFAKFLNAMASKGLLDLDKTDLVGFSIGSHIAGMVGKHVNGKISRIIALDPAYPLYDGKGLNERLHVDDAQFVAVIHTSGKFISFEDSLGHADFYPNGGKFPQPLCMDTSLSGGTGLQIIPVMICSHTIVVEYFAESIFNESQFMATQCQSWTDYPNGTCASDEIPMGYATPKSARGNYYLKIY